MRAKHHILARAPRAFVLLAAAVVVALSSCAYYNMLYNAKEKYKEAEKQAAGRDGEITRQQIATYDVVIEKCQTMIGTWPNSRHVDDAMLLIARCLFQQQRYGECVAELDSLEIKHPKTNLMPQARFLKGKALAEWGEHVEAVQVLDEYCQKYRKGSDRPEALYYLATSSITLGREDEAVRWVGELEKHYSKNPITFEAQVEIARILGEKGFWEKSRDVYETLNQDRLPKDFRFPVWMGLAQAYVHTGQSGEALALIGDIQEMGLTPQQAPQALLLKAQAWAGVDSTDAAIRTYKQVTSRYSRGSYAAEAHFRLGEIYEEADSLELAKQSFDSVPRAYSGSDFANEAIRRSGSIGKLLRLEEMASDSPEAQALRQFSLAELQLTQFHKPKRALELYQELVQKYPGSEVAPRALYATGYIYGIELDDSVNALGVFQSLQTRYPDTQQARFAYLFLPWMDAPPAAQAAMAPPRFVPSDSSIVADSLAADSTRAAPVPADSARAVPADTTANAVAPVDSAVAPAPADTTAAPAPADTIAAPAPADTSGSDAPADTSGARAPASPDTSGAGHPAGDASRERGGG